MRACMQGIHACSADATSCNTVADADARVPEVTVTCSWLTPLESSAREWVRMREGGVEVGERGGRRGDETSEERGKRRGGREKQPRRMAPPSMAHASR